MTEHGGCTDSEVDVLSEFIRVNQWGCSLRTAAAYLQDVSEHALYTRCVDHQIGVFTR